MKKFYIAYSIHGTNAFIVATLETKDYNDIASIPNGVRVQNLYFTVAKSRMPNPTDTKLHWDQLNTLKGEPMKSPYHILRRFKILEKAGWTINKDAFIKRHYVKGIRDEIRLD